MKSYHLIIMFHHLIKVKSYHLIICSYHLIKMFPQHPNTLRNNCICIMVYMGDQHLASFGTAIFFVSTFYKITATLCHFWNSYPNWLPLNIFFFPTKRGRIWQTSLRFKRCCPNSCLIHTSFNMLDQCILCWWETFHALISLAKNLLSGIINT